MTIRHEPTPSAKKHIYVDSGTRLYQNERLDLRGASPSLERMIAENQRHRLTRILTTGRGKKWVPDDRYDQVGVWSRIYEIPVNTMLVASRIKPVYGPQKGGDWEDQDYPSWGPLTERASALKILESRARRQYRQEHRDGTDPMKEIAEKAARSLPAPADTTEEIFVAVDPGTMRMRVGFFTTYEAALKTAPESAEIIALNLNGRTSLDEGRVLRGWIGEGWGYLSGYGPSSFASMNR